MQIEIEEAVDEQPESPAPPPSAIAAVSGSGERTPRPIARKSAQMNHKADMAPISRRRREFLSNRCGPPRSLPWFRFPGVDRIGCFVSAQSDARQRVVTYHRPRVFPDFAADAVKCLCLAQVRAVRIAGRDSIDEPAPIQITPVTIAARMAATAATPVAIRALPGP